MKVQHYFGRSQKSKGLLEGCRLAILLGICLSAIAFHPVHASNIDSLRTALRGLPADSNGVKTAIQFTIALRNEGATEAEEFGKAAESLAKKMNDPKWIGEALITLGSVYHFRSNYESALKVQMEAGLQFRKAGDETGIAKADVNIAAVYLNRDNYDVAEKYLLEANEIVQRLHIVKYMVTINTNLAIIYTARKQFDKAMERNEASLAILKEKEDLPKLVVAYSNIGYLYGQQQKLLEALEYYGKAYETGLRVGQLYYETGFALQNKLSTLVDLQRHREAEALVGDLESLVEKAGSARLRAESMLTLSRLYNGTGNYKKAFAALETYHTLQDSMVSVDQNTRIAEMEKEHEMLKKDAELKQMAKEAALLRRDHELEAAKASTQWRLFLAICLFAVVLLVGLAVMVVLALGRNRALKALKENHGLIEDQKREIELQNEALKVQNDRLEDLNREKDGLISIVAHDLKSPLNKSLGLLELIQMQGPLNEEQKASLGMIQRVSASGNDLIRDLLDLNAVEHPDAALYLEDVDLLQFWKELEVTFSGDANRKSLTMVWEMGVSGAMLHTDRKSVSRVMDNLVSNAMKFSPKGKQIRVSLSADGSTHVLIVIEDQGPGISEEEQKKLFKKFQRLSARPTGGESSTGLGLAITQALVHKIGGEIWVRSKLGAGTSFFVRLPLNLKR